MKVVQKVKVPILNCGSRYASANSRANTLILYQKEKKYNHRFKFPAPYYSLSELCDRSEYVGFRFLRSQ